MRKVPEGWEIVKVGQVFEIKNGFSFKSTDYCDDGIPLIRISDITDGYVKVENTVKIPKEKNKPEYTIEYGDLLVALSGATTGKMGIYFGKIKCLQNQRIGNIKIKNNAQVDEFYRNYYFKNIRKNIEIEAYGGAQPNISPTKLYEIDFILPPKPIQQKIVTKLDAIMPRITECKARLERIPGILKRYKQAVLNAAVTGKLTEDWRGGQGISDDWENKELVSIIKSKPRNGYSPNSVSYKTKIKSLTLTATTSGVFKPENYKYLDVEITKDSHLWIKNNDILIQRSNTIEYVGVSAIVNSINDFEYIYPDLMMKIEPIESICNSQYLYYYLLSSNVRSYFRENATGTAGNMPKINQKVVCATLISLPPLAEQQEIVRRVKALFGKLDSIQAKYDKAAACVNRLDQAVLAKAFRGELV